jgi:uncharacterized protein (TIRG00374 family)
VNKPVAPKSQIPWKAVSTVIAFALAAMLLYFSLRGIEWRGVWELALAAQPEYLAIACAVCTSGLFFRAVRWRILLAAQRPVTMKDAFWATCAGYFGNNFLPARAGELIRTYMIHARSGMSNAYVLTTALSERVADAITLVAITAVSFLLLPQQSGWLAHAWKPFAVLAAGGIVALAFVPRLGFAGHWLIGRSFPSEKLHAVLDHVISGIRVFHDPRRLLGFGAMTVSIWSNDAVFTMVAARAVHLTISAPMAFLLIAGLGLSSALPSTPGYVGIYQFVAVSVLVPFGISRTNAIGFILLVQAVQYLVVGVWGGIGFWKFRKGHSAHESQTHVTAITNELSEVENHIS